MRAFPEQHIQVSPGNGQVVDPAITATSGFDVSLRRKSVQYKLISSDVCLLYLTSNS